MAPTRKNPRKTRSLRRLRSPKRRARTSGSADAALRLLGLAARAGAALGGTGAVRDAVRRGARPFVILAADASSNTKDRLLPLLRARGVAHVVGYRRSELGDAIGRAPLSAVGVLDSSLARRLAEVLEGKETVEEVGRFFRTGG